MENILPIILYDINGNQLKNKRITIDSPSFYFYSYQNLNIQINAVIDKDGNRIEYEYDFPDETVPGFANIGEIPTGNKINNYAEIIGKPLVDDSDLNFEGKDFDEPSLFSVLLKTRSYDEIIDEYTEEKKTIIEKYYEISKGTAYVNFVNFGYTLNIPTDETTVELQLETKDGITEIYQIKLELQKENIRELYNDLLINHYLPNYDELIKALAPNSEKREIIKRLLLDFNNILISKGTTESIRKFFYFIGFLLEQIQVYEEFVQTKQNRKLIFEKQVRIIGNLTEPKLESVNLNEDIWITRNVFDADEQPYTLMPDKTVDTKTGNYHIRYNNWDDGKQDGKQTFDEYNLPYRPFAIKNLEELEKCLKYAIPLANKYFIAEEQHITFFGIAYSSNLLQNLNIISSFNKIIVADISYMRKYIHINIFNNQITFGGKTIKYYLTNNCVQKKTDFLLSEVKYTGNEVSKIGWIDSEVLDNQILPDNYHQTFGLILWFNLVCNSNVYLTKIHLIYNDVEYNLLDNQKLTELDKYLLLKEKGSGKISLYFTDDYNNIEKFTYSININENDDLIDYDFEINNDTINCKFNDNLVPYDLTNIKWTIYDCLYNNEIIEEFSDTRNITFTPDYESNYGIKVNFKFDGKEYEIDKPEIFSNIELE